jgi:hypothetical protein
LVNSTFKALPDNVQVTVSIQESKANQLRAEVFQDVTRYDQILTVPVTLPILDRTIAKIRVTGCVYAASQQDLAALTAVSHIFPGMTVWSTAELKLGFRIIDGQPTRAKVVTAGSPDYRRHLAVSTLALDLGGIDPALPSLAAELGVPCLGLTVHTEQARLWPELSLEIADPLVVLGLVRWLWTDQGEAAALCQQAQQRLISQTVC